MSTATLSSRKVVSEEFLVAVSLLVCLTISNCPTSVRRSGVKRRPKWSLASLTSWNVQQRELILLVRLSLMCPDSMTELVVLSAYPLSFNSQKRVQPEVTVQLQHTQQLDRHTLDFFLSSFSPLSMVNKVAFDPLVRFDLIM